MLVKRCPKRKSCRPTKTRPVQPCVMVMPTWQNQLAVWDKDWASGLWSLARTTTETSSETARQAIRAVSCVSIHVHVLRLNSCSNGHCRFECRLSRGRRIGNLLSTEPWCAACRVGGAARKERRRPYTPHELKGPKETSVYCLGLLNRYWKSLKSQSFLKSEPRDTHPPVVFLSLVLKTQINNIESRRLFGNVAYRTLGFLWKICCYTYAIW